MLGLIFLLITLLSVFLVYYSLRNDKRVLLFSLIWLLIYGFLAAIGFFKNTDAFPPRFLLVLFGAIVLSILIFRRARNYEIRLDFLILVHVVRIPVELVLYQLFLNSEVPQLMTFKGWNFDIIIGVSALIVYAFFKVFKSSKLKNVILLIWNVVGIIFLLLIVVMAILSAPTPIQQLAFEQPNKAVLSFPFIYLPSIVVPIVFVSHLAMIRQLIVEKHKD